MTTTDKPNTARLTSRDELRLMLMNDFEFCESVWISKRERHVVKLVVMLGNLTSSVLSEYLGISSSNASTTLANLHRKGYLGRIDIGAPSGGVEFSYSYALKKPPEIQEFSYIPDEPLRQITLPSIPLDHHMSLEELREKFGTPSGKVMVMHEHPPCQSFANPSEPVQYKGTFCGVDFAEDASIQGDEMKLLTSGLNEAPVFPAHIPHPTARYESRHARWERLKRRLMGRD